MSGCSESKEVSFLCSALTSEGDFMAVEEVLAWYRRLGQTNQFAVQQIPFSDLDSWYFAEDPYRLAHRSGRFFTVEGLRVVTNYGAVSEWDQPIINQPEIGILGIITKVFQNGVRYFLMQGKMEPGNINTIQLSPTVQATRSNYKQVHQGKKPLYLEYFMQPDKATRLIDQLQTEQGARFLRKRNRNMIVDVTEDIPVYDHFCWLTLGQIQRLLTYDNLVNMDARTVLSCIPFIDSERHNDTRLDYCWTGFAKDVYESMLGGRPARHTLDEILSWFTELKTRYELAVERIPLNQVRHWVRDDYEIRHETGRQFSVIAVSVQAENREVVSWTQPLLKHTGHGLVGFLVQNLHGMLHVLVRASMEPGNFDTIDMGPTVACSRVEAPRSQTDSTMFLDAFLQADPHHIRYSAVQSEEGGRFYHFQNRYMIVEVPPERRLDPPDTFIWMTLAQIYDLLRHGYFNIEARSLLACLNVLGAEGMEPSFGALSTPKSL